MPDRRTDPGRETPSARALRLHEEQSRDHAAATRRAFHDGRVAPVRSVRVPGRGLRLLAAAVICALLAAIVLLRWLA